MSWEHSHYETAYAVYLHECDGGPPNAVFRVHAEALGYIAKARRIEMLDDHDGDEAAAKARGAKPEHYLHDAGVFQIRNCFVPWWNSMGDVDHEPGPVPDYELAELVRLNAPEAGEDTLAAVERRLAEWHLRKYGPGPVDLPRTLAKLGEEFGELCRAFLRGERAIGREAADMVFVLFHLVRGCGYSLADAVQQKLPVIERRLVDPAAGRGGPAAPAAEPYRPGEEVWFVRQHMSRDADGELMVSFSVAAGHAIGAADGRGCVGIEEPDRRGLLPLFVPGNTVFRDRGAAERRAAGLNAK